MNYKEMYTNPLRQAIKDMQVLQEKELKPDVSLPAMRFWEEFFLFKSKTHYKDFRNNIEIDSKGYNNE
jgi:hypothetical protein